MDTINFKLEIFEGPLDLLLHLLSKNKVDIYDIPIALILDQYNEYLRQMEQMDLEIASEFLVMSSHLLYIKSKMLLPKYDDQPEEDDRDSLVRMLLEYQQIKQITGVLLEQYNPNSFTKSPELLDKSRAYEYSHVSADLLNSLKDVLQRASQLTTPSVRSFFGIVGHEQYPVNDKIAQITSRLRTQKRIGFLALLKEVKTRSELVAVFLAVLELCKLRQIDIADESSDDFEIQLNPDAPEITQENLSE